MKKFMVFIIVFMFYGCGGQSAKPVSGTVLPAYFYNSGLWDEVINASMNNNFIAVVNPDYGPGDTTDSMYETVIGELDASGKTPVGYVYTKWGNRSISDVENDIDKWIDLYPDIKGFFLDEANASASDLGYYKTLYGYIKNKGDYTVVINPGTFPDEAYFSYADIVVVFEDEAKKIDASVCRKYPSKSAIIAYGASSEQMKEITGFICRYKYVTDANSSNPYGVLPSYFNEEINYLK